jgi:hypothetical protein
MWGSFGQLMRHIEVPAEFRLTWDEFCHPPEAKFRQFRPTMTHELATGKRLAQAR